MKKNFFLVLFALLALTQNVKAQGDSVQDSTYCMVVTMPNGSTFVISTNDVDEVSFTNGRLKVSGTSIEKLLEKNEQLTESVSNLNIKMLENLREEDDKIAKLVIQNALLEIIIENNCEETDSLNAEIADLQKEIATLKYTIDMLSAQTNANLQESKIYTDMQITATKLFLMDLIEEALKDYVKKEE